MTIFEKVGSAYRFKSDANDYVYIGDEKDTEFHPKVKVLRWANECSIQLGFDDSKIAVKNVELKDEKVQWSTPLLDIHFYPAKPRIVTVTIEGETHEFRQNDFGGIEIEVILKEKPATNKLILPMETKGLTFYKQKPLHPDHPTWVKNEHGMGIRPENVVGSYAVYHESKRFFHGSKYKAGKAFHIYRPKLTDEKGDSAWADDMAIQDGNLIITLPQAFLNKATYPVTIDPEFGYHTIGGSSWGSTGYPQACRYQNTAGAGTVHTVYWYYSGTGTFHAKHGMYGDDAGECDDLLEGKGEFELTMWDWNGQPGFSVQVENNAHYWLACKRDSASFKFYYDDGDPDQSSWYSRPYASAWDDPWGATNGDWDVICSAYAEFTPAAAGGQPYISRVQRVKGMRTWGGISSMCKRAFPFKLRSMIKWLRAIL